MFDLFLFCLARAEVNDTGFVSCDRGYWLEPDIYNFTVTCDATGRWLPTPNCIPITCVEPEILENADRLYMGSNISNMRFVYQQVLEYRCTTGFWVTPGMLVVSKLEIRATKEIY